MSERVGNEIMQAFVEDHVTPFMRALGDMRLKVGRVRDLPPLPANAVDVVHGVGTGGPYIKMLPTAALMAWAADVRARAEAGCVTGGVPVRREAITSRDGSHGYIEIPASAVEACQGEVAAALRVDAAGTSS